jgi:ABC-type siderophore export system fused ATPase/permease subunit
LYKEIFYHKILPDLKKQGKCIIVISHDDRYFHCADKIIKLENGVIQEQTIAKIA